MNTNASSRRSGSLQFDIQRKCWWNSCQLGSPHIFQRAVWNMIGRIVRIFFGVPKTGSTFLPILMSIAVILCANGLAHASDAVEDSASNFQTAMSKEPAQEVKDCETAVREILGIMAFRSSSTMTTKKMWSEILWKLIAERQIEYDDFEKIDFSFPGDRGYGDNPKWEFFNPEGIFKAPLIPQDLLDRVTTEKGTRPVFNVRSTTDPEAVFELSLPPGTRTEHLYIIIPNISPDCAKAEKITSKSIKVAIDNHEVVYDENLMIGFIQSPDSNQRYLLTSIMRRIKTPGAKEWLR